MTSVVSEPGSASLPEKQLTSDPDDLVIIPDEVPVSSPAPPTFSRRRIWLLVGLWIAVVIACFGLVVYGLEPLFTSQRQSQLLTDYRGTISRSANELQGLPGASTPTKAVEPGDPVAVLEVGSLRLQQVVVEGVSADQTADGPGHVPGTAAPGQPGNSVVVGRRTAYSGPFHGLDTLGPGDQILVTTTQGQVVYDVSSVESVAIDPPMAATASTAPESNSAGTPGGASDSDASHVQIDDLYGPTSDDRLTLVTSDSVVPWNSSRATVLVATMDGLPFPPTPQNGRVDSATGISGSAAAWAPLVLALHGSRRGRPLGGLALPTVDVHGRIRADDATSDSLHNPDGGDVQPVAASLDVNDAAVPGPATKPVSSKVHLHLTQSIPN